MANNLYVYNIALKRDDGKVEQDTIYRDKLFTVDEIKAMAVKFSCSVLVSCIGTFSQATKTFIKDNTILYELPKPKAVENDK